MLAFVQILHVSFTFYNRNKSTYPRRVLWTTLHDIKVILFPFPLPKYEMNRKFMGNSAVLRAENMSDCLIAFRQSRKCDDGNTNKSIRVTGQF